MNNKSPKKNKSPLYYVGAGIRGVFLTIGRVLATFVMVGVITGCIVASVMTVYILQYVGADDEVNLESEKLGYTSIIYYTDENGTLQELQRLYNVEGNRTWIDYDEINEYTKMAMVAVEDKRFWSHQGVDWRRTLGASASLFIPGASRGGGSTIHQQLIKNLTGDDDYRIDRKVREIFRALNLAQNYTHEQVLEAYLNVVPFGQNTNGIQAAAKTYFDKDAKDLTLAEAACIVGITQKPTAHNPFLYPEVNKERQEWVLFEMLDQGLITEAEYNQALKQKLNFKKTEYFESLSVPSSYFADHVIDSVITDLADLKGWTRTYAEERLFKDGYKIYTTVDMKIQNWLEEYYLTWDNFPQQVYNEVKPQSACTILDPNGKILGLVGGIGEKTVSRGFNRATMAKRHPGSSMKPLGVYSIAFEYDRITWSTLMDDNPVEGNQPMNYDRVYRGPITIDYAIYNSVNTIAWRLADMLTPRVVFDFLKSSLSMDSLIERQINNNQVFTDIAVAPMALGSLTEGLTPLEMAGGYQIFVNGGKYTKPYAYYRVVDAEGKTVLEPNTQGAQVISEDTATVLNKLLQRVTTVGTGRAAHLGTMPTGGKTGTSTSDVDQWFIGFTPYYICQVWLGYDTKTAENNNGTIRYGSYPPPLIFHDIMEPLHEGLEPKEFFASEEVVSLTYCTISGDLASANCTSTQTGWYKSSRKPGMCTGHPVSTGDDDLPPEEEKAGDSGAPQEESEKPRPLVVTDDDD